MTVVWLFIVGLLLIVGQLFTGDLLFTGGRLFTVGRLFTGGCFSLLVDYSLEVVIHCKVIIHWFGYLLEVAIHCWLVIYFWFVIHCWSLIFVPLVCNFFGLHGYLMFVGYFCLLIIYVWLLIIFLKTSYRGCNDVNIYRYVKWRRAKNLDKKYMCFGSYDPFEITNVHSKKVMNMLLKHIVYITALKMMIGISRALEAIYYISCRFAYFKIDFYSIILMRILSHFISVWISIYYV